MVPILQEAGWAPGPVWTGGKSRPHRDSIPDHPARSQLLNRLSYRAHSLVYNTGLQSTIKILFSAEVLKLCMNDTFNKINVNV